MVRLETRSQNKMFQ